MNYLYPDLEKHHRSLKCKILKGTCSFITWEAVCILDKKLKQ